MDKIKMENEIDKLEEYISSENIPKIIYHFAPANKDKWHAYWFKCLSS